jgi:cytochrome c biogenesis protein CcmG/thiol:disulfide interchange protein DsbE
MMRWIAWAPLLAIAALAALFLSGPLWHDPQVNPDALVGKPLPASRVTPVDGGPDKALTEVARGPVIVNVFASWCVPCRAEQGTLLKLKADGVPVVGLSWKDKPENTRGFLTELGDPYLAVLTDEPGRAGLDLGITGVPETFLVDGRGVIVAKRSAPLTEADAAELEARWRALGGTAVGR